MMSPMIVTIRPALFLVIRLFSSIQRLMKRPCKLKYVLVATPGWRLRIAQSTAAAQYGPSFFQADSISMVDVI
jgi:hypothetical protein